MHVAVLMLAGGKEHPGLLVKNSAKKYFAVVFKLKSPSLGWIIK
jgi:hypothetical protein